MSSASTLERFDFASLPDVAQEHIFDVINDYGTYLALSLTCKYFSERCTRRLYQTLKFPPKDVGENPVTTNIRIRRLQCAYIRTLTKRPELAVFTRHLSWEITNDLSWLPDPEPLIAESWATFEQLSAVRSLDLWAGMASYDPLPPKPLFPNLVRAKIGGTFVHGTLTRILHTSPHIKHLVIAPCTLENPDPADPRRASIEPFLRDSVNFFTALRTLDISLSVDVDPALVIQFVESSAETIELLRVDYYRLGISTLALYEEWFVPMLQSGRWRHLAKLVFPRLRLTEDIESYIKPYCPSLINFEGGQDPFFAEPDDS